MYSNALIKNGFNVTAWNHTKMKRRLIPKLVSENSNILLPCLRDEVAVEEVFLHQCNL